MDISRTVNVTRSNFYISRTGSEAHIFSDYKSQGGPGSMGCHTTSKAEYEYLMNYLCNGIEISDK